MTTTTIRVSRRTRESLHELADISGLTLQQVLEQALELYRRRQLLEATNSAYAALESDAIAWADLQAERDDWDATLADGLEGV
jgi:predicted transcriptional regulator